MIMSNPYEGERRPGAVGPPLPGVSARIVDEDGERARRRCGGRNPDPLAASRSPSTGGDPTPPPRRFTTAGFARATSGCVPPTATTRCAAGAVISSSAAGSTSIRARSKSCCSRIERVREAAVIGVRDDVRGEVPIAYIVARRRPRRRRARGDVSRAARVVQGPARVRPDRCAAAHRARQEFRGIFFHRGPDELR